MQRLSGVVKGSEPLVLRDIWEGKLASSFIYLIGDDKELHNAKTRLEFCFPTHKIILFPGYDCIAYDRASPSTQILSQRIEGIFGWIQAEKEKKPTIIVLTADALLRKFPALHYFKNESLMLSLGDTYPREKLFAYLHDKGYTRTETVYEMGQYAVRGSLVDFFPVSHDKPLRLDFLGDEIESIRRFDVLSQKTLKGEGAELLDVVLRPVSELLLTPETIEQFRTQFRSRFDGNAPLYKAISEGRSFPGMEHFLPLFYEEMTSFLDEVKGSLVLEEGAHDALFEAEDKINLYYQERLSPVSGERPYYPVTPKEAFITGDELKNYLEQAIVFSSFDVENEGESIFFTKPVLQFSSAQRVGIATLCSDVMKAAEKENIIFACRTQGQRERVHNLFKELGQAVQPIEGFKEISSAEKLKSIVCPINESFIFKQNMFLPDVLFFGKGGKKTTSKIANLDRFFRELQSYAAGDFLVHAQHGIGKYLGLETVEVERIKHDCVLLEYENNDRLFVPVENMDLLTHFAREGSVVTVDKLGTAYFQSRKAKIKKKLLEIAEYLLKVAAQRQLKEGSVFAASSQDYETFCKGFPYVETDDQERAIGEVEADLISGKPMDRLVCGDVGFGKTEVALRAAFLAMAAGHQVALVVPTTLLARQHFASFKKRFQNFPYHIEMLCRLVPHKQAVRVKEEVESGRVNLLIATHAAFSKNVRFAHLGLLIVDEEQHFGVKQKEKLKTDHPDIHILTLTATPIPRTLQMSLSGIRDLSLITTPPVDRLPIRTFVMEQDWTILKDVILREYNRGGQIFFVSPRLEDLPWLKEKLEQTVPGLKIAIANGQMAAADLEDTVQDFYDHRYDILLSTNIIESGIDIANANTLIVHKAHLFGLAQLYQIRGRIGRSKKQGYAYITVPQDAYLSDSAQRRLKVLQTLDHLGAGFTLASHDLDIRGGGNLLGEEQSGHIREVGVELYQQMLQEAILSLRAQEVRGEIQEDSAFSPSISLGIPVLIPETYIADLSLRLGLYKRIALLKTKEDIDAFQSELVDRFGQIPEEVKNLLSTVELKQLCLMANIEKIDAGSKGIVVTFFKNKFLNPQGLLEYIQQNGKLLKIRPDQKLVLIADLDSIEKRKSLATKLCQSLARLAKNSI